MKYFCTECAFIGLMAHGINGLVPLRLNVGWAQTLCMGCQSHERDQSPSTHPRAFRTSGCKYNCKIIHYIFIANIGL